MVFASHLVGPDPLVGDQLISLSPSEFAIAATVLELDEPAPFVVIIVNHGSCMCSVISATIGASPLSEMGISMAQPWCRRGLTRKALLFLVADEVPADLFQRHLRVAQLPGMR